MISLNPPVPNAPRSEMDSFFSLLALVSDPTAAKAHLKEIIDARMAAVEFLEAAKNERQTLDIARNEQKQALEKERDEHDRGLADARTKFEAESAKATDEIRAQRASAESLEKQAKADAEAAAALKIDLQRRIDQIKAATA